MPTILQILGWRLFFYSNESNEPMHIHAKKSGMECKFWFEADKYDIKEAFSHGLKTRDQREIRKIIFDHFDYIVGKWKQVHGDKNDA